MRTHGDGRTITLATFGPGDIFGELAMFEDERRSATVEAIETTSVVGVLGPDMRRLMKQHPEIAARLVIALGRRLREMNERLSRQSFQTVQSRVAVVLSDLVVQEIAAGKEGTDVLVTATQADLAQLAGSSRESASRFLAVLERAGVISRAAGGSSSTTRRRWISMSSEPRKKSSQSSRRPSPRRSQSPPGAPSARPKRRRASSPPAASSCAARRS